MCFTVACDAGVERWGLWICLALRIRSCLTFIRRFELYSEQANEWTNERMCRTPTHTRVRSRAGAHFVYRVILQYVLRAGVIGWIRYWFESIMHYNGKYVWAPHKTMMCVRLRIAPASTAIFIHERAIVPRLCANWNLLNYAWKMQRLSKCHPRRRAKFILYELSPPSLS